jgi:SusD family.
VVKYVKNPILDNHRSNVNWYLLRYSDVLLLYAEALNEWHKAPNEQAFNAINQVRRRANGKDVNTPDSAVDLDPTLSYNDFSTSC